ncbi:MAG: hypothetical protein NBV68_00755 [Erythrobacter sp.]|uniref:hypothetical protein n=1 Tax=Erythrobacter sp. TaxID=1042 RepID=UPI0025E4285C|nr:hypothetical protein [Erythrobacter sp.]MCL9997887.1 hypothetical protein [Erythrobacter sp.]
MVFDLGKAMRKKEEFESARLMDFDFRQRVRATRLLARALGIDEAALVEEVALRDADGLITLLAGRTGRARGEIEAIYAGCLTEARKQLIIERGDPTPNRLG